MEYLDKLRYETDSPSACYDFILQHGERSAEALYYLLTRRLARVLDRQYQLHGAGLRDEFSDTIDDYFLYLHDGLGPTFTKPFAMLEAVREKRAFFSWLISTYRHFLLNKQRFDTDPSLIHRSAALEGLAEEGETEESLHVLLATAIAYADQELPARNRFILYRMLLFLLDEASSIPQEAMAEALGMHPVTYRVCTKRQKDRFLSSVEMLNRGEALALDVPHVLLRDRIAHHFDQLYEWLLQGYEQALEELPEPDRVVALRERYSVGRDGMMHEGRTCYGISAASILHRLQEEGVGGDGLAG